MKDLLRKNITNETLDEEDCKWVSRMTYRCLHIKKKCTI